MRECGCRRRMTGAGRRSCARAGRTAMRSGARSWIGARGDSLSICPGAPAGGRAYWRVRPNAGADPPGPARTGRRAPCASRSGRGDEARAPGLGSAMAKEHGWGGGLRWTLPGLAAGTDSEPRRWLRLSVNGDVEHGFRRSGTLVGAQRR